MPFNIDQDRFQISPDQVFPSFLVGVGLWGKQLSTQHRLRDGSPELIHIYPSLIVEDELNILGGVSELITHLHMVYSPGVKGSDLGSLRVAAIRESAIDTGAGGQVPLYQRGARTRLTLDACISHMDPSTYEAVMGFTAYELEFQEPTSRYHGKGDICTFVGNTFEGLVGTNSSSAITAGRYDLYVWGLVEAMIRRNIIPENAFIEGQLNIAAVLYHILLGNQVTQW